MLLRQAETDHHKHNPMVSYSYLALAELTILTLDDCQHLLQLNTLSVVYIETGILKCCLLLSVKEKRSNYQITMSLTLSISNIRCEVRERKQYKQNPLTL